MMVADLSDELYQSQDIKALEKIAIEQYSLSESILMERAAYAAFCCLKTILPECKRMIIICGPGNNGGDGYTLAKIAHQAGILVKIYYLGEINCLQGITKLAKEQCQLFEIPLLPFDFANCNEDRLKEFQQLDVIVDAIFGIGLNRTLAKEYKQAIEFINSQKSLVMSLDVPSGVNADTGYVEEIAVKADITCTFIGMKKGLLTGKAPDYVGDLYIDNLDIPDEAFKKISPFAFRITQQTIKTLGKRRPTTHKGEVGHVLIVGGNIGMPGSVRMAAEAALRCGAGLVTIATRANPLASVSNLPPEIMCWNIEQGAALAPLIARATVIVVGPGLGKDTWAKDLFSFVLTHTTQPLLIDADALHLLAENPSSSNRWILTPHPGEAAHLLECSVHTVEQNRFLAVKRLQEKYQGIILLKGKGSLIKGDTAQIALMAEGNPGMASGGMGDVLSGVIASLLAQGLSDFEAVKTGSFFHAMAANSAAQHGGERGLVATDLMPFLRQWVNT